MVSNNNTSREMAEEGAKSQVLVYKDSFHPCHVLETLRSMYQRKNMCDVVIVVQQDEIFSHRLILAANSSYFYTMFTNGMSETNQTRVTLKEVDPEAVRQLVEFCYTSTVEITEDNVQNLLSVANLLQFTTIIETCCCFLKTQLHPSNCLGIGNFADHHDCAELKLAALNYAEKRFLEVAKTDEFLQATPDQMSSMLKSDSLNVVSEKDVFDSVLLWTRHRLGERKKYLPELLKYIRLALLPPKILVDCIESDDLVQESDTCMRIISEAKNFHLLPERRDKMQMPSTPRQMDHGAMMYVIGGEIHNQVYNTVQRFNFETEKWDFLTTMHQRRDGVGVASHAGFIYAAGGCDGDIALSSVECFDQVAKKWTFVQSMTCGRHAFSLVELDGWLYAAGGSDFSGSEYSSVERYDPVRDMWSAVTPMSTMREGIAMVTLDGTLYAMGGDSGVTILNSVERFDPRIGQWSACIPMGYRRRYFGAAVLKKKIMVVGGSDNDEDHNSFECYDPRMNRWLALPPLEMRRESPAAVVVDDRLLAMGGAFMNAETDSIECYDPLSNKWEKFHSLPGPLEGMGVVII